jgi:amino acid transporter
MDTPPNTGFKRVLRSLDITLFTVCAILVIDTLAPSAAIGPSALTWYVITLVVFFIPYGLMTAELGAAYTEQGGLYVWVKRAFGERWAARSTWLYWINVALWMPSVYILFASMFSQLFFPDLSLWPQIGIALVMTWITVWIGTLATDTGKWVPNLGALLKAGIMITIGVGAFIFALRNGVANDLSLPNLVPSLDVGLAFWPVIIYNFMGFELMSGAAEEMKNPGRDIPRAIIISGVLIAAIYLLGTLGILLALPQEELGLVSGIIDTLRKLFGESGLGGLVVTLLGIGALYTLLANMVTWTMGANRTAAEAAAESELPAVFGRLHPVHQTPSGAFIITGLVSSVVIVLYGFMAGSAEDLFWTLFAFSSMIFLMPYLALFPAFVRLRRVDAATPRPYRFPGAAWFGVLMAVICELFIAAAIVLFVYTPGQPFDLAYAGPILVGVVITLAVGELLLALARRRKQSAAPAQPANPSQEA